MKYVLVLLLISSTKLWAECKTLKICWENYKPYQMKIGDKVTGFDLDLLTEAASKLNCKVEFENTPWKRCLIGIENGTFDGAASATKNPEREVYAYFSTGYYKTANVLFTKKDNIQKYNFNKMSEILNFKSFNLLAVRGYDYGEEFQSLIKRNEFQKHLTISDNEEQNFKFVALGKADGMYADELVGNYVIKELNLDKTLAPVSKKLPSEEIHFMFSKKSRSQKFVDEFNKTLESLKANGYYNSLLKKYMNK